MKVFMVSFILLMGVLESYLFYSNLSLYSALHQKSKEEEEE